jgi:signal transduction histidine kinase
MWSLRRRLTITVVALVASVLVVVAIGLYVGTRRAAWRLHDEHLVSRARSLAAIAEYDHGYELALPRDPAGEPPIYVEAWRPDGNVLARSPSLGDRHLDPLSGLALDEPTFHRITFPDGLTLRAVALRFVPRAEPGQTSPGACTIAVATGDEDVDAVVASARTWFIVMAALGLVAIAAVTAWSLARGLRPLARLAAEIERVDDDKLGAPLAIADPPAELAVPIAKLDELLARLGEAFARERRFTADVSHELRTPLAGLRSILEVTALVERSSDEYKQAIADARAIVVQLGAVIDNMLLLARLDAGHVEVANEDVALRALVDECWKPHAAHAAARGVAFTNSIDGGAIARGDREKLRVVVGNLLSNAAEYTDERGWIEVTGGDGGAIVDVVDSGPAIPDDQLARVFDRMWRGDAARTGTGVHCGVGLAVARALCDRLGLAIAATTRGDGSVSFRVAAATPPR